MGGGREGRVFMVGGIVYEVLNSLVYLKNWRIEGEVERVF